MKPPLSVKQNYPSLRFAPDSANYRVIAGPIEAQIRVNRFLRSWRFGTWDMATSVDMEH